VSRSATRQSSELPAKASMASVVMTSSRGICAAFLPRCARPRCRPARLPQPVKAATATCASSTVSVCRTLWSTGCWHQTF